MKLKNKQKEIVIIKATAKTFSHFIRTNKRTVEGIKFVNTVRRNWVNKEENKKNPDVLPVIVLDFSSSFSEEEAIKKLNNIFKRKKPISNAPKKSKFFKNVKLTILS